MTNYNEVMLLSLMFFAAWFLRRSFLLKPLVLMVTLFHECGHALTAIISGGRAKYITFSNDASGQTLVELPNSKISALVNLSGGYLGSVIFGSVILYLPYTRFGNYSLEIVGTAIILVLILLVRGLFAFVFSLSSGIFLILLGWVVSGQVEMFIAKFIGVCCILNSLLTIERTKSDSQMISRITFLSAFLWRLIWLALSALVLFIFFSFLSMRAS